jgi:hypothetical protein
MILDTLKKSILLISLLFAIPSHSQDLNTNDWGSWVMLYGTNKISSNFNVITEFRLHNYGVFNDLDNQFVRLGLTYEIGPGVSITAGYIHQYSELFNNIPISENRPYEEITFKNKFKKLSIAHRYRIEHRWVNIDGSTVFSNRMRYRLMIWHPIYKGLYAKFFNEIFLNLKEPVFNQNRFHLGLGYAFHHNLKLELGYLKNHFSATDFDIFRIGIIFNTDLRKKPISD